MKLKTKQTHENIILYDGVCKLCDASVNFIAANDKSRFFKFAQLQSPWVSKILGNQGTQELKSIVYLKNGTPYYRSTAALMILKELDHPLRVLHHLLVLPTWLRNPVYDLVAKFRYKLFGKHDTCVVPTKDILDRFIDQTDQEVHYFEHRSNQ